MSEPPPPDTPSPTTTLALDVDFNKVSFKWLFEHLPIKIWLAIAGSAILLLTLGIYLGQVSVVQEYLGKKTTLEQPTPNQDAKPDSKAEELMNKLVQLSQAHLERRQRLMDAMSRSGESSWVNRFLEFDKLRADLNIEDIAYQRELTALLPPTTTQLP